MIDQVNGFKPKVPQSAFVAENAVVMGDVELGEHVSVWYSSVLRADINWIRIGDRTNIQDGVVIHVNHVGKGVTVGSDVLVGHRVVLHACTIGNGALIGNGAIVLDGAEIGEQACVAAGSVVPPNAKVPPGTMVMGAPCKVKRPLTQEEIKANYKACQRYVKIKEAHRDKNVVVEYGPDE